MALGSRSSRAGEQSHSHTEAAQGAARWVITLQHQRVEQKLGLGLNGSNSDGNWQVEMDLKSELSLFQMCYRTKCLRYI